ncbi:hypothetical protein [Nonomuraea typhae]|uniref:hypothetical protein n=1 Tax=Nonomuraea typhae TaxID=2603600 RepID=UPI0012FC792A|nr:hypothetical protein [Nonomuraea typhae]
MAVPRVVITALGVPGAGSTTLLHAMYDVLSLGVSQGQSYYLRAESAEADLELRRVWKLLADEGRFPPRRTERPVTHTMTLRDGRADLAVAEWTEHPGDGAEQLAESDTIVLVLDGGVLGDPLDDTTRVHAAGLIGAARMSFLLQHLFGLRREHGGACPSIAVVVTKFDQIARGPDKSEERLIREVRELLPLCFEPGTHTMVCPVRAGVFPGAQLSRVDPELVSPRWVHLPMLFAVMSHLDRLRADELAACREQEAALERDERELRRRVGKTLGLTGLAALAGPWQYAVVRGGVAWGMQAGGRWIRGRRTGGEDRDEVGRTRAAFRRVGEALGRPGRLLPAHRELMRRLGEVRERIREIDEGRDDRSCQIRELGEHLAPVPIFRSGRRREPEAGAPSPPSE